MFSFFGCFLWLFSLAVPFGCSLSLAVLVVPAVPRQDSNLAHTPGNTGARCGMFSCCFLELFLELFSHVSLQPLATCTLRIHFHAVFLHSALCYSGGGGFTLQVTLYHWLPGDALGWALSCCCRRWSSCSSTAEGEFSSRGRREHQNPLGF